MRFRGGAGAGGLRQCRGDAAVFGVELDANAVPGGVRAATMVVPVPQKESRTVSPTNENIWTRRELTVRGLDVLLHNSNGLVEPLRQPYQRPKCRCWNKLSDRAMDV